MWMIHYFVLLCRFICYPTHLPLKTSFHSDLLLGDFIFFCFLAFAFSFPFFLLLKIYTLKEAFIKVNCVTGEEQRQDMIW